MLHTYLIYQRPLDDELIDIINTGRNKPMADAYFNLSIMQGKDNATPEKIVHTAMVYSLYQPTMFMQYASSEKSLESTRLEAIFAEGNGKYSIEQANPIKTTHLMKHSSLSVGDIVVNLLDNIAFVCMPTGWHELEDTTLELNV